MDLSLLLSDSKPLEIFKKDKREGELSHAYALFGEDVFAMEWLLREMAKTAVCPVGGCGKCAACTALDGGVHPDVKFYSDRLDVRDVNELLEDCAKYSVEGGLKVYVVFQLDKTLAPAQNKLLKTVEEPPEGVLFLFGIVKPNAVTETLRSRCKKLYYTGVEQSRLEEALERECGENENSRRAAAYAGGNISRALKFAQDAEFARDADDIIALLGSMQKSGNVPAEAARLIQDKEHVARYLDITEIVLNMMEKYKRKLTRGGGGIAHIAQSFSYAALGQCEYLVNDCRKRLESNCAPSAVLDTLLFGILEVKYKCR